MNYEIAYLIAALVVLVIHIILAYQASIIADAKGTQRYNVGNSLLPDWFLRLHIGCSTSRQKADEKRRENC